VLKKGECKPSQQIKWHPDADAKCVWLAKRIVRGVGEGVLEGYRKEMGQFSWLPHECR